MVQKQEIVIRYFRQGQSQREIAKSLGLNRKTVKRYIKEYVNEKAYSQLKEEGVIGAPHYNSTRRTKRRLTNEVQDVINAYLKANEEKRSRGNVKQCMKATDIHESLVNKGYQIGYTTVSCYIKAQYQKGQEVYIRQQYAPGSCTEFDWGTAKLTIGGKQKNVMLAVFTMAYSNHRWAMLFYRQDMSSFLHAHVQYLNAIQGVPKQFVYDNLKTAVARFTIKQSDKTPTQDLLKMSSYYQFGLRFCNAGKGNEKGHVERSVEYVRRKAFNQIDQFDSLDDAQQQLFETVQRLNGKCAKGKSISIDAALKIEQGQMIDIPVSPYDHAITQFGRVDKYHTICVDTNHYSVPEQIYTPMVEYRLYPHQIVLYDSQHKEVASHIRVHAKYQWCIDIGHYWKSLVTKPGALHQSQALDQASAMIKTLYKRYYAHLPQVFIHLCLHCKENKWDMTLLGQATKLTLRQSPHCPLTVDKVKWNMFSLLNHNRLHSQETCANNHPLPMTKLIDQHCEKQLRDIQSIVSSF